MGLFSINHFVDAGYPEDEALNLQKLCNSILMSDATIVTGNKFEDGGVDHFCDEKKSHATHVGILTGVAELGNLPRDHVLVEPLKPPTPEERARAAEARAARLKAQAMRRD